VINPARAIPLPESLSGDFLMRLRDICPQMTAGSEVIPIEKNDRMPRTRLAMARPEVFCAGAGGAVW
jgi:hypothetical protein